MAIALLLKLLQTLDAMLVGGAHGGLVGLEDVAGARRTITSIGGQWHRAAPPFDGVE